MSLKLYIPCFMWLCSTSYKPAKFHDPNVSHLNFYIASKLLCFRPFVERSNLKISVVQIIHIFRKCQDRLIVIRCNGSFLLAIFVSIQQWVDSVVDLIGHSVLEGLNLKASVHALFPGSVYEVFIFLNRSLRELYTTLTYQPLSRF